MSLESYIVRIYRREVDGIAGVVEETSSRRVKSFRSLAELLELLRRPPPVPRRRGAQRTPTKTKGDPS
jgi:hypothetical protein